MARIRKARESLLPEVTQSDLAARLSVRGLAMDRPTVTRIDNGKRYLRDFEIGAIAKVLDATVGWRYGESGN